MIGIILKIAHNFIKILKAEESINSLSLGFVLGGMMGLPPTNFLYIVIMSFFFVIFKINITTGFLGYYIGLFMSFITILMAKPLAVFLLELPALNKVWTSIVNAPVVILLNLNNTAMLGQIIMSFILAIPSFLFAKYAIGVYRTKGQEKIVNSRPVQYLKSKKWGRFMILLWRKV